MMFFLNHIFSQLNKSHYLNFTVFAEQNLSCNVESSNLALHFPRWREM